jgi:hypothetical protein
MGRVGQDREGRTGRVGLGGMGRVTGAVRNKKTGAGVEGGGISLA